MTRLFVLLIILIIALGIFLFTFLKQEQIVSPDLSSSKIINNIQVEEPTPFIPNPLALDQIFSNNHTWVKDLPQEKIITLIATGDVIPARVVNQKVMEMNNFKWPYEKTADVLSSGDITFIDLETPLIKNCPIINTGFKFCGEDRHVEGLFYSGVDVASLANNHSGNYGSEAVYSTAKLLEENGILSTGTDKPEYLEVKGQKFAFLGYNDIGTSPQGVLPADEELIKSQVREADLNSDVVVVAYHWGTEYQSQPDKRQVDIGHLTIDSGADLVIGNHPHWIQPIEIYKGRLITYAHGNFVFDQEWSQKTKEGVVGRYTFYENTMIDVEYLPILIEDYGQPRFLELEAKQKILDEMKRESEVLKGR